MLLFQADLFGVQETHTPDFTVDHTHSLMGDGEIYELMCFSTPFVFISEHGPEMGQPGDAILYTPNCRVRHQSLPGAETGFVNDWIYIRSRSVRELAERIGLPLNVRIPTRDPLCLRKDLLEIQEEAMARQEFYRERVSLLIEDMLFLLARTARNRNSGDHLRRDDFIRFRQRLRDSCSHAWSVETMAETFHLSASRFSVLYRQQFGVSPTEDLLDARVNAARILLRSTEKSIRQIAEECGFQNEYYFSRVFRNRVKIPPGRYRK